jgi:hypothetical protein
MEIFITKNIMLNKNKIIRLLLNMIEIIMKNIYNY